MLGFQNESFADFNIECSQKLISVKALLRVIDEDCKTEFTGLQIY